MTEKNYYRVTKGSYIATEEGWKNLRNAGGCFPAALDFLTKEGKVPKEIYIKWILLYNCGCSSEEAIQMYRETLGSVGIDLEEVIMGFAGDVETLRKKLEMTKEGWRAIVVVNKNGGRHDLGVEERRGDKGWYFVGEVGRKWRGKRYSTEDVLGQLDCGNSKFYNYMLLPPEKRRKNK